MTRMTAQLGLPKLPGCVEAVVLFGSRARGDSDSSSDTDLAVFARATELEDLVRVKDLCVSATKGPRPNFSVYSTSTATRLARQGSLFLWHLRLEGRLLMRRSEWLDRLLSESLRPYDAGSARRDLETFRRVAGEVEAALLLEGSTKIFEAATLFAVLRGTGMIVGMRTGEPSFSRMGPILRLQRQLEAEFALSAEQLSGLVEAKLLYSGRSLRPWTMKEAELVDAAAKVRQLLERSFDHVC